MHPSFFFVPINCCTVRRGMVCERASGVNWVGICADEWNEYNESIIYHEKHHVFCTFMCV
jgi:hypothetical protein